MAAVFSAGHAHGTSRPEYASMLRLLVLPEPCFPSFVVVSGLSLRGGTLQAAIGGCVIIAGSASGSV